MQQKNLIHLPISTKPIRPFEREWKKIATEIYGADGVDWSREAQEKLNRVEADSDNALWASADGQNPFKPLS